jgi:hypothetical protein
VASKIATANAQSQAPKITGGLNSQLHPMLASFNNKQDDNQTTFIPKPNFATAKVIYNNNLIIQLTNIYFL